MDENTKFSKSYTIMKMYLKVVPLKQISCLLVWSNLLPCPLLMLGEISEPQKSRTNKLGGVVLTSSWKQDCTLLESGRPIKQTGKRILAVAPAVVIHLLSLPNPFPGPIWSSLVGFKLAADATLELLWIIYSRRQHLEWAPWESPSRDMTLLISENF